MNQDKAEKLVDLITSTGNVASIYPRYSGRGMFGAETVGVTTNLNRDQVGELISMDLFRVDNLGLDWIIY